MEKSAASVLKGGLWVDRIGGETMARWIKTTSPGVRFREHPTRKHGIMPDRYYAYFYKIDGKRIEEGLGWASQGWTQEKAANTRHDMKKSAKNGGPKTTKEIRAVSDKAITVKEIIEEIWEKELKEKKSGKETMRLLQKDVLPAWGRRKVEDIKRRDIVLLLDKIQQRAPITRNRVHGALSRLFNFAAERGVIEDSPCTRIKKPKETSRARVLTDEEINNLWTALDVENADIDIYRAGKLALKMILLTGQRSGEICGMRREELSDDGVWTIPPERMKNKKEHKIPLVRMALGVIEQARMLSGNSPYIFQSSHLAEGPITPHSLSKAILRHWPEMKISVKFTPHDIRRTVRTKLAEVGIDEFIAERVLGHLLQGMMAIYNIHDYVPEKQQALEKWERRLMKITCQPDNGQIKDNIIDIKTAKRGGRKY